MSEFIKLPGVGFLFLHLHTSRYTLHMDLFNKTFYRFFFGFLGVLTVGLFIIFIVGSHA